MTLTISLFEVPGGYGYQVQSEDGVAFNVHQDCTPGAEGFVPMTRDQAQAYAEALVASVQGA